MYREKVLLIVNVASRCAFTKQYAGLESLYQQFKDRGFVILGFPCDQFGHQEPGDEATIQSFCSTTYNVGFPMFRKIEVNGPQAHPLYRFLADRCRGLLGMSRIQWNFTKFLIDRQGTPIQRFAPMTTPASLQTAIEKLLDKSEVV